jgi:hypothetical protein
MVTTVCASVASSLGLSVALLDAGLGGVSVPAAGSFVSAAGFSSASACVLVSEVATSVGSTAGCTGSSLVLDGALADVHGVARYSMACLFSFLVVMLYTLSVLLVGSGLLVGGLGSQVSVSSTAMLMSLLVCLVVLVLSLPLCHVLFSALVLTAHGLSLFVLVFYCCMYVLLY